MKTILLFLSSVFFGINLNGQVIHKYLVKESNNTSSYTNNGYQNTVVHNDFIANIEIKETDSVTWLQINYCDNFYDYSISKDISIKTHSENDYNKRKVDNSFEVLMMHVFYPEKHIEDHLFKKIVVSKKSINNIESCYSLKFDDKILFTSFKASVCTLHNSKIPNSVFLTSGFDHTTSAGPGSYWGTKIYFIEKIE